MECPDTPWDKDHDYRIKKRPVEQASHSVVFFLEFLKSKGIVRGKLVDIGCGNGRNAIYFAENGFEVHAVDRFDEVLQDIDLHGVMPHCHSVTDYWFFEDDYFDLAMDILCYSEQDDEKRDVYISELRRVLKPGSYFLLSVPATYSKEKIEREFSGFTIVSSKETEERFQKKTFQALSFVMKKLNTRN